MMTLRPVLSRSTQLASSVVTGRVEMYSEQDTGRADDRLDYMYVLVKGIDGCGCCVVVLLATFSAAIARAWVSTLWLGSERSRGLGTYSGDLFRQVETMF